MEAPTLIEFIRNLAGGGMVSVIVAFALEHIPLFQRLQSEVKKWAVLALYVALPLVATALIENVPADFWATAEPYWSAVALGFLGWIGTQVAHAWDKRNHKI